MEPKQHEQISPETLFTLYLDTVFFVYMFIEDELGTDPDEDTLINYQEIKESESYKQLMTNPATHYQQWPLVPPININGKIYRNSLDAMISFIQKAMVGPEEILSMQHDSKEFKSTLEKLIRGRWKDANEFYNETESIRNYYDYENELFCRIETGGSVSEGPWLIQFEKNHPLKGGNSVFLEDFREWLMQNGYKFTEKQDRAFRKYLSAHRKGNSQEDKAKGPRRLTYLKQFLLKAASRYIEKNNGNSK